MDKIFKLHKEKIIGYKTLTEADLGQKITSHQTHIGLFDDILTFLPNQSDIDEQALLIYEKEIIPLSLNFNRIQNPDGSYRSPKIRIGNRDEVSIVSTIRDFASKNTGAIWYLFWFGLESEQIVFLLFNNESNTYKDILGLGLNLKQRKRGRITKKDSIFNSVLDYIEQNIDCSAQDLLKELEIDIQLSNTYEREKKLRKFDIQKAQQIFSEIGRQGEVIIAKYFENLMLNKEIKTYSWMNRETESSYPYDFYYQDLYDNIIYVDVKTTKFEFEQKIVYSDKEIAYALTKPKGCYNIFRVYNLGNNNAELRICKDCLSYFTLINDNINQFQQSLHSLHTSINTINIAFSPNVSHLFFESKISLIDSD